MSGDGDSSSGGSERTVTDTFDPIAEAQADDGPLGGITVVRADDTLYRITDRSVNEISGQQQYTLTPVERGGGASSYPTSIIERWLENDDRFEPVAGPAVEPAPETVTVDAQAALVARRELRLLISETDCVDTDAGEEEAMTPLARARWRIAKKRKAWTGLDDRRADGLRTALGIITQVSEETGAEISKVDPLQDDIFEAKRALDEALDLEGDDA